MPYTIPIIPTIPSKMLVIAKARGDVNPKNIKAVIITKNNMVNSADLI